MAEKVYLEKVNSELLTLARKYFNKFIPNCIHRPQHLVFYKSMVTMGQWVTFLRLTHLHHYQLYWLRDALCSPHITGCADLISSLQFAIHCLRDKTRCVKPIPTGPILLKGRVPGFC